MASRLSALLVWAAVAASLAFWGLRWFAHPVGIPEHANVVGWDYAQQGDVRRLLAPPVEASAAAAAPQQASRFKLLGVIAPRTQDSPGAALISIDNLPPRAYRVGVVVDGDWVLQSIERKGAALGPAHGSAALSLDLPDPPMAATGSLPPPTGATTNPAGANARPDLDAAARPPAGEADHAGPYANMLRSRRAATNPSSITPPSAALAGAILNGPGPAGSAPGAGPMEGAPPAGQSGMGNGGI